MHIDAPADLQTWMDSHHAEVLKAIPVLKSFDGGDDKQIDLLKKFTSDDAFRLKYEDDLMAAVKNLKAPDKIQKEITEYRDALHKEWNKFSDSDKSTVLKMVNNFSRTTTKQAIIGHVAATVEGGSLSPRASSTMIRGIAPLLANIPWWCFICYTVPIWGLICIAVKSCRGGVATTSTNPTA